MSVLFNKHNCSPFRGIAGVPVEGGGERQKRGKRKRRERERERERERKHNTTQMDCR